MLQIDAVLNSTDFWSRSVSSEIINMTDIQEGVQVIGVTHITADYYKIMKAGQITDHIIKYLNRYDLHICFNIPLSGALVCWKIKFNLLF